MRVTCDLLTGALPVAYGDDGTAIALWAHTGAWPCRERPLEFSVLAAAPIALPAAVAGEPVPGAIARLAHAALAGGGLLLLRAPGTAPGREQIAFAAGVRLFAITSAIDEACWDAALSLGLPIYGVRGRVVCAVRRPSPQALIAALAYGGFTCEDGLALARLDEDRAGVRWQVVDPGAIETTVVVRGGFPAARLTGPTGEWRDRGNEGYVRLVVSGPGGCCWTQPRFIAPRADRAPA